MMSPCATSARTGIPTMIPSAPSEMKVLKLGTVSVDGSRIKANASIYKSIRYDRARELEQELKLEIDELFARAESEDKVKDRNGGSKGRLIKEPKDRQVDAEQANMTDTNSRVTNNASDSDELARDIAAIPAVLGKPTTALADKGYASEKPIKNVQDQEIAVLVSATRETDHLQWVRLMAEAMGTDEAKKLYRLRKQSVEPVFGIVKQILGFRQFLLRG